MLGSLFSGAAADKDDPHKDLITQKEITTDYFRFSPSGEINFRFMAVKQRNGLWRIGSDMTNKAKPPLDPGELIMNRGGRFMERFTTPAAERNLTLVEAVEKLTEIAYGTHRFPGMSRDINETKAIKLEDAVSALEQAGDEAVAEIRATLPSRQP